MKILAFDTCLDKTYVTLSENGEVLKSEVMNSDGENYHSAYLISTIIKVLRSNDLTPKDIDMISTDIGPGSFTGIRACTTVARVLAQQLNIKAVGISSLEILSKILGGDDMVVLDARKNKAYLWHSNGIQGAVDIDEIQSLIASGKFTVITDDKLQPIFGGLSYQQGKYPIGEILSEIVVEKLKTSDANWAELKPLYIQPPPMG